MRVEEASFPKGRPNPPSTDCKWYLPLHSLELYLFCERETRVRLSVIKYLNYCLKPISKLHVCTSITYDILAFKKFLNMGILILRLNATAKGLPSGFVCVVFFFF